MTKEVISILHKLNKLTEATARPSAIDMDLMLDYTRQLYDRLLSERSEMALPAASPSPDDEESNQADTDFAPEEEREEEAHPEETTRHPSPLPEEAKATDNAGIPDNPITEPAQDPEETLYHQRSNISFEPPHPAEEPPVFTDQGIEEDEPEKDMPPLQKIPVPLTEEEDPADYARIFNYNTSPKTSHTSRGDIRKQIGINDKYLFLNELFYSKKQAYEEALDKLNELTDYEEALSWITHEIANTYNWDEHDETVQDFYEVLARHFSAR